MSPRDKDCRCPTCGISHEWCWEEAFDKFGFGDGDGLVMTNTVAAALRDKGYRVEVLRWGIHNDIITSIARDAVSWIPQTANVGYDNPRHYLPQHITALLDKAFPKSSRVPS